MRKALVVGLNEYPKIPLTGCVNDALSMRSVLETHGDGSPNFAVRLITAPTDSVTKDVLKGAIDTLFEGPSDIALLYFAGHGHIANTGGYIVTPDFKKYDEGVSMDEILKMANASKAKDKIVIFDCCHSGAFGSPAITSAGALLSDGLSVLTACRDSESADEINGCGVFTSLVVEALKGGGADLRGHVTPGSVYAYVDQALGPWEQRPIFKTNVTRFTALRSIQPPIPAATLREIGTLFPTPQTQLQLDPSYEDTSPNADPAKVVVFKKLQKMQSVGLVVPVGAEFMYFAAMDSKTCRLTALGYHYWQMVKQKLV